MVFQNLFESPLPIIKADTEKIVFNINGIGEGYIHIKNIGGGSLKGEILSNASCISFDEKQFEGNELDLRYEVDTSYLSAGDRVISNVVIISTGGEINIPVVVNVMAKPFLTEDNTEIFSLKDFYAYAKNKQLEARRILCSNDFMLWLKISGFEHIDVLEEIIEDADKERALDNFFVLSGIKKKADIYIEKKAFEYKIKNKSTEILNGIVNVKKIGTGYINARIYKKNNSSWLKLFNEKLTGKDFDENGNAELYFEIDTNEVEKNIEETIIIETEKKMEVKIRLIKLPLVKIRLNKECFSFEDSGEIYVENYSERRIEIEVKANDNSIRFEKESYFFGRNGVIDFKIKTSSIAKNMLEIQKNPYINGIITLLAWVDNKELKYEKKIIIGEEIVL